MPLKLSMNLINIKLSAAILIIVTTLIAAWLPFKNHLAVRRHKDFFIGEALASGIFLGLGLIHMLGEADHAFIAADYHYPLAFLLAGSTFLILLFCEHIGMEFSKQRAQNAPVIVIISILMLSIHSLLEGFVLGVTTSTTNFLVILIAILAHKWAASFSLAIKINQSSLTFKQGGAYFGIFMLMAPLGILTASSLHHYMENYAAATPFFNALAAGTFIYIGTLHGLKRSVMIDRCCDLKEFAWVIVGFLAIALLQLW